MKRQHAIQRARKLKALAERGVAGEAAAAAALYETFVKKWRIAPDELERDPVAVYCFPCTREQFRFAAQVWASIMGGRNHLYLKDGRNFCMECTESQYVTIRDRFTHYWALYQREREVFYNAFIQANKLYDADASGETTPGAARIMQIAKNINRETPGKKLDL